MKLADDLAYAVMAVTALVLIGVPVLLLRAVRRWGAGETRTVHHTVYDELSEPWGDC